MTETDWKIPPAFQPDPREYRFDLDRTLEGVVGVKAMVPSDAFTAAALGTEREGSGVVINANGLVLTIGYLIAEAETVWLTTADGRALAAHVVAYDHDSGFGLVQALGRLNLPVIELGDSRSLDIGEPCALAAAGGRHHAVKTRVVGREPFAGYWEYLLENAIFTAPAHPVWGGGALIGQDGKLLGVGSLIVQQSGSDGRRLDMNMVVPVERLTPVLGDLLARGRPAAPPTPWLGLFAAESEGVITVQGVTPEAPAEQAGLREGDRILAVGDEEVSDLAGLWRAVRQAGPAGATVRLRLGRGGRTTQLSVTSADRTTFLRPPRLH